MELRVRRRSLRLSLPGFFTKEHPRRPVLLNSPLHYNWGSLVDSEFLSRYSYRVGPSAALSGVLC